MQTIELNGRPIAVMDGNRKGVEGDGFRADLFAFVDRDDCPLWDGRGAFSPSIREALPEEAALLERSFGQAVAAGEADLDDSGDWLAFLMDVYDTTERFGLT